MTRFWRHFITNGHSSPVQRRLGLYGRGVPLPGSLFEHFELNQTRGLEVRRVEPAGPADEAGLVEGDVLVELAERPVTGLARLHRLLDRLPVGVPLPAVFFRRGRRLERWVVLEDRHNPARRE